MSPKSSSLAFDEVNDESQMTRVVGIEPTLNLFIKSTTRNASRNAEMTDDVIFVGGSITVSF